MAGLPRLAVAFALALALAPTAVAQCPGCGGIPVADAGPDRMVAEGSNVTLSGTHRGPTDVLYDWAQVAGPVVLLANATTPNPSFTAPRLVDGAPVELLFRLQVSEAANPSNRSRPDFVSIRVVAVDAGPIADAGGTQTVFIGQQVVLDGTRSLGIEGRTLSYEWSQILRPDDVFVLLVDNQTAQATFVAPDTPGELHFRLRVSDGFGVSQDEAVVLVRLPPTPPAPRILLTMQQGDGGAEVTFVADPPDPTARWDFGDGAKANGTQVTHRFAPGTYNVTLTIGQGASARSVTEEVFVPRSQLAGDASDDGWLVWVVAGVAVAIFTGLAILVRVRRLKGGRPR